MFNLEVLDLMVSNINSEVYEQMFFDENDVEIPCRNEQFDPIDFQGLSLSSNGNDWFVEFSGHHVICGEEVCSVDDGGEDTVNDLYNKVSTFINEYIKSLSTISLEMKKIKNEAD